MSHERRVFLPLSSHTAGTELQLPEDDAHHLRAVVRLEPGDPVTIVDTVTQVEFASFVSSNGRPFLVRLGTPSAKPIADHTVRGLLMALCKNKANDLIAEKATELGVDYILFFQSDRSVVRYHSSEERGKRREKLQKIAGEASKQSARSSIPEVFVEESLEAALAVARSHCSPAERFFFGSLTEGSKPLTELPPLQERASVLIGPEGDLTPEEEKHLLAAGFEPFTLGNTRLRSETAACAAIAAIDIFGRFSK